MLNQGEVHVPDWNGFGALTSLLEEVPSFLFLEVESFMLPFDGKVDHLVPLIRVNHLVIVVVSMAHDFTNDTVVVIDFNFDSTAKLQEDSAVTVLLGGYNYGVLEGGDVHLAGAVLMTVTIVNEELPCSFSVIFC